MNNIGNSNPPKKNTLRKKTVDLKAVAALLEDSEDQNRDLMPPLEDNQAYRPNEDLIQATQRIRSQRDLIHKRLEKMHASRERVSKTVFDKIHRDYQLQLDTINKLLNEKKSLLKSELDALYLLRGRQTVELNRHREILEEARFRHFLEEFTEEQYKEVEGFENKEIQDLEGELAKINSYIKLHEELFDERDQVVRPAAPASPEVTRTVAPPAPEAQPAARKPANWPAPEKEDDFSEKTPIPEALSDETLAPEPEASAVRIPETEFDESATDSRIPLFKEESTGEHLMPKIQAEEEYFSAEQALKRDDAPASPSIEPDTGKTILREPDSPETTPPPGESILDILENSIDEPEGLKEIYTSSLTPTPARSLSPVVSSSEAEDLPSTGAGGYKLVFLESEGISDIEEFTLKDNVSIGRSPSNDLALKAPKVSRQHAAINKYKDQYILIDLKSSNGVFVNGRKIDEHALEEGDEVSIGGYKMKFVKA